MTTFGVSVAQAAKDLDIHATVLRLWVGEFGSSGPDAVPRTGQLKPDDGALRSRRREVAKLKAERDIPTRGETILRHCSEDNGRTPPSPGTICDVWVCCQAPSGLARELDM